MFQWLKNRKIKKNQDYIQQCDNLFIENFYKNNIDVKNTIKEIRELYRELKSWRKIEKDINKKIESLSGDIESLINTLTAKVINETDLTIYNSNNEAYFYRELNTEDVKLKVDEEIGLYNSNIYRTLFIDGDEFYC